MSAREQLGSMVRTDRGDMNVYSQPEVERALDAYRAEVIADRDAQIIAWLVKKAAEEGSSNKDSRVRATAIYRLADKLSRGAVRPPLSKGPEPLLTDTERQFLTFALDLAFDAMVSGDGFTNEDDAALAKFRRMADEAATGGAS